MRKPTKTKNGFPSDPILALRATELLARGQELFQQNKIADAARVSAELTHVAPDLAEGHQLMGELAMRTGATEIALVSFQRALALKPRSAGLYVATAQVFLALHQPQQAIDVLAKGRINLPNDAAMFRELGQAQLDLGQRDAALKSFTRAIKLDRGDQYAVHMVAALGATSAADKGYVANLFDGYAAFFDEHLTGTLGYRVPQALAALIANHSNPTGPTLDLGCGTGLVAEALPKQLGPIDGIDIAPKMLAKAEAKGLYRQLRAGDAETVLASGTEFAGPYGLVIAADVFIYIGQIDNLLALIAARLATKGLLAFSIETTEEPGMEIRSSGRFAHSRALIETLAAKHGLAITVAEDHPIRQERERPIPGTLYLLSKL